VGPPRKYILNRYWQVSRREESGHGSERKDCEGEKLAGNFSSTDIYETETVLDEEEGEET
jgi:hypothetical protein